LKLASDTSLRDLTVENSGTGSVQTALLAITGTARTLVADVTAQALGSGTSNSAIVLTGSGTGITLQQVTALAENGSNYNSGLVNSNGASATLRGGFFTAKDGMYTNGIFNAGSGTELDAMDVTALGEGSSKNSHGFFNNDGAVAVLHGGSFTARAPVDIAWGIFNGGSGGTTLEAYNVTALGENATSHNVGLGNFQIAVLHGGSFTALGGTHAYGIDTGLNGTTLEAEGVAALAEGGSSLNNGLGGYDGAAVVLHGGSFIGRDGAVIASGIYISGTLTTLETESVTALGENCSYENFGLYNLGGADAVLSGGSFIARAGTHAWGIYNQGNGTTLEAENVAAMGENGSIVNAGLFNNQSMATVLNGGTFSGSGGQNAYGILNEDSNSLLEANNIIALAENGNILSFGFENFYYSEASLRGGTFIGIGGAGGATGIANSQSSTITIEGVSALAENGNTENFGMANYSNTIATIYNASFTGRGGQDAIGIKNETTATIKAENVTSLGENGSNASYGLYNDNATSEVALSTLEGTTYSVLHYTGAVTVSHSLLAGNVVSGTVICVAVTRGSSFFAGAGSCP
jgi:hypothetical protein